jgi:hypothetical protein
MLRVVMLCLAHKIPDRLVAPVGPDQRKRLKLSLSIIAS